MVRCNFKIFIVSVFLLFLVSFTPSLLADQKVSNQPSKTEVIQKTQKLQIPFIANDGQTDEKVKFYANTFGGTVFVTKEGEIVYSLPNNSPDVETQCLASLMHSSKGIRDEDGMLHDYHVSGIMHPASWIVGRGSKSDFQNHTKSTSSDSKNLKSSNSKSAIQNLSSTSIGEPKSGVALKEEFVGAKVKTIQGEDPSVTKVNYFKGKDPSKWKTDISTYDMVNLGEIYKGIDLKLKAYGNNVEKLFCVKPGANPNQIKIKLSGINPQKFPIKKGGRRGLSVNESGELEVETELGPVKFTKPIAYQKINGKRVEVECGYVIADCGMQNAECKTNLKSETHNPKLVLDFNRGSEIANPSPDTRHSSPIYCFTVASYDKTKDLIIDPLLASTYLGASGNENEGSDYGNAIAIGSDGNIYIAGYTGSPDFPTTTGAYDASYNGNGDYDVFISKLSGDLTSLLASTYLSGSDSDYANSIAIDSSGNVYVAGYTSSSDFPTSTNAYDESRNNEEDIFISKFDSNLTNLLASTFLGGSNSDYRNSIAIDSEGNVYVTGYVYSSDFPTTTDAYDTSYNDSGNVFVSKLSGDLTSLLASTFLGGSDSDYANSIAIDSSGNVYVAGYTESSVFPTTTGAYDTQCCDYYSYSWEYGDGEFVFGDAFVSKLNGSLTSMLASTYLGGSYYDYGNSISVDTSGNVYVVGYTDSADFPTTQGAYSASGGYHEISCDYNFGCDVNYGDYDIFISKLNSELTTLLSSTCLGGEISYWTPGYNTIAIDSIGNIYVAGYTNSPSFPTTTGVYDISYNDDSYGSYLDVFVSKLSGDLTSLIASTYLGGSDYDYGNSIAIDASGNVYVAGYTYSSDFPTTTGAYDISYSDSYDVFVSKLNGDLTNLLASTYLGGASYYYDDYCNSITIDSNKNIYIVGYSNSSNFPTNVGAYDAIHSGGKYNYDIFVSKLSDDLTSLLASTYLGGANSDYGSSIAIDSIGNIYVAGYTNSPSFPTTTGAYDTSYNHAEAFVSKLNSELSNLLASTFLGGSGSDYGNSITIDSVGNVYVIGYTSSLDFPTTTGAYDISYSSNGFYDVFISKLNGNLTSLFASTYLGGTRSDSGNFITLDSSKNVYVTGHTYSADFPITPGSYDVSFNNDIHDDVFVSKLNGDLTNLLASTFLGGSAYDGGVSIAIDSIGNVYVSGYTSSSNFPITPYAMNAYYSDSTDAFISKLDNNLTNLLSSTYIKSGVDNCIKIDSAGNIYTAGSSSILKINDNLTRLLDSTSLDSNINSIALDSTGNIYVAGYTDSTKFQTTTGVYDTYNAGDYDAFITKFNDSLSSTSPTVTTGTATDIKSTSTTLNGSVNANGASTDVWFEYDTTIGSYSNTTSTQFLSGLNGTDTVSIEIGGLSPETTYYYRIAGQNSAGITYGSEMSFTTNSSSPPIVTTLPATDVTYNSANLNGYVNANEFLTTVWFEYGKDSGSYSNTSPTTSVSGSDNLEVRIDISGLSPETTYYYRLAAQNSVGTAYGNEMSFTTLSLSKGNISGYVSDIKGNPIESVKLSLKGKKTKTVMTSFSNSDGFLSLQI